MSDAVIHGPKDPEFLVDGGRPSGLITDGCVPMVDTVVVNTERGLVGVMEDTPLDSASTNGGALEGCIVAESDSSNLMGDRSLAFVFVDMLGDDFVRSKTGECKDKPGNGEPFLPEVIVETGVS